MIRSRGFTFINVFGLTVGIAACLLIALYIRNELSYDQYHKNKDRIYRVIHAYHWGEDPANVPDPTPSDFQVWGNAPVGPALKAGFPEVTDVVQFSGRTEALLQYGERRFQEENVFFADATVFDIFSWGLLAGDPGKALEAPYSVVLTQTVARKYFGKEDPLGKTLIIDNDRTSPFTVTGVMEDVPANSHFTFDVLISMNSLRQMSPEIFKMWDYVDFYTYFTVGEGVDIAGLEAKISGFVSDHIPEYLPYTLSFESLKDVYLHSQATRQPGVTGNMSNIYIFSVVALFILFIACVNFINLSTARSMERAREVGVRKVAGAQQVSLIKQFQIESLLLCVIATLVGYGLAVLFLPAFQELSDKEILSEVLFSPVILLILAGVAVLSGLLAGLYPAFVLARFKPVTVLKGTFRSSMRGIALRKGLVICQFSLSVALIAGTAVVFSQLSFLQKKDLGFQKEQMLVIDFGYDGQIQQKLETFKNVFMDHPAVLSASASRMVPGSHFPQAYTQVGLPKGEILQKNPDIYEIDFDFIPSFDIQMAAGRAFSRDFPADTAHSLLINEAAAKLYGFARPEDAVGKHFAQWGRDGTIIGVVKDFNYQSLHSKIQPLTLRLNPQDSRYLTLRLKAGNISTAIPELEQQWEKLAPQRPFLYSFLDDSFNRQYQADSRFGKIFSVFAILAICIACLGLFGLSSFAVVQRTKEIGVRKVLGATALHIVVLLSKDFLLLIGIAIAIAVPLAYFSLTRWLEGFAYRIDIQWWIFAVVGLFAVIIALLTVSFQSVKAALMNPMKSLRSE